MYEATEKDKAKWSFQIVPDAPDKSKVSETLECEALVVGAGLGGLSAACRLKELGVTPLVLEKSGSYSGRGGHFGVPNSSLMEEYGLKNDLEEVARQWIVMSGNDIDQELLWTFLKRSKEAMDWLLPITVADGTGSEAGGLHISYSPVQGVLRCAFLPAQGKHQGKLCTQGALQLRTEDGH